MRDTDLALDLSNFVNLLQRHCTCNFFAFVEYEFIHAQRTREWTGVRKSEKADTHIRTYAHAHMHRYAHMRTHTHLEHRRPF